MRPKNVRRRKEQHVKPIIGGEVGFLQFCVFFSFASYNKRRKGRHAANNRTHTESRNFEVQLVRLVFKTSANF